jgi:hypothetical protein
MEALRIFKNYSHTQIRVTYYTLYITICISEIYFGYALIYLSAIDFTVIVNIYSTDFNIHVARGLFQGIVPIGRAVEAIASPYFVSKLSRRSLIINLEKFYSFFILLQFSSAYSVYTLTIKSSSSSEFYKACVLYFLVL